jgi:hypothetical protein
MRAAGHEAARDSRQMRTVEIEDQERFHPRHEVPDEAGVTQPHLAVREWSVKAVTVRAASVASRLATTARPPVRTTG